MRKVGVKWKHNSSCLNTPWMCTWRPLFSLLHFFFSNFLPITFILSLPPFICLHEPVIPPPQRPGFPLISTSTLVTFYTKYKCAQSPLGSRIIRHPASGQAFLENPLVNWALEISRGLTHSHGGDMHADNCVTRLNTSNLTAQWKLLVSTSKTGSLKGLIK